MVPTITFLFTDLAKNDGYQTIVDSLEFTPEYLKRVDIVMIITALPFDFTTKNEGNSQGLAGTIGKGKVVAFGDSNGFTAMLFDTEDGPKQAAGMNLEGYDWKQFVLNTLHWLSGELE